MVHSDPVRLKRIVFNLLSRSAKVTKDGHIKLVINELADLVEIRVEDSGEPTTPVNQISRLFSSSVDELQVPAHEAGVALGLATA